MPHYHPCEDRDHERIYREVASDLQGEFERTKNPVYAWREYRRSREHGAPIPGWVISYFDGCAVMVRDLARTAMLESAFGRVMQREHDLDAPSKERVAQAISQGFGFTSGRGKRSAFEDYGQEFSDQAIALHVAVTVAQGETDAEAFFRASERFGVSERTVERIWRERVETILEPGFRKIVEGIRERGMEQGSSVTK